MTTHRPVIVGVGQHTNASGGRCNQDPVELASEAISQAFLDAGLRHNELSLVDSLDAVNVLCWRYAPDFAHAISRRLGIAPAHCVESPVGGQQPIALLDRLSAEIAGGRRRFGIICGAEAQASVAGARRAGQTLPWPPKPARVDGAGGQVKDIVHPELWRHGLRFPIQIYPLFENAYRARLRQTLPEAQADSARMWADMSEVAARNPQAWYRTARSPIEVATPSKSNRWIYFPYTKLMNAAPNVDQGAAVLVLDEDFAFRLGISPDKFVYPCAGAGATEITDPLQRPTFDRSVAMEATLDGVLERSNWTAPDIDAVELYSCFPVVPKMARDHLRLESGAPLTVAGGLSFFGGPGNDYMLHALASITAEIRRQGPDSTGLAYGQGEFVTKHHAVTLAGRPPATSYTDGTSPLDVQATIDASRDTRIATSPEGPAVIETYTATWDPTTEASTAFVIGRLISTGERFVARSDDAATVDALTSLDAEPVGMACEASHSADVNTFRIN